MLPSELISRMRAATMAHDLDSLHDLLEGPETGQLLQSEVLPWVPAEDCFWFWHTVQPPADFDRLLDTIRDVLSTALLRNRFRLGEDFSWIEEDGLPVLLLQEKPHACIKKVLPPERYSTARIVIREVSAI